MPGTPVPARKPTRGWLLRCDRALPCHRGPGVVRPNPRLVGGTRREPRGVARCPAHADRVRRRSAGGRPRPGHGPGLRPGRATACPACPACPACLLRRRSAPARGRVGAARPPAPDITVGSMTAQPIRDGALGGIPASCSTRPHAAGAASCRVRRFRRHLAPAPGNRQPDARVPGAGCRVLMAGPCGRRRVPSADAAVPRPLQETGERTGRAVAASRARKPEHPAPIGRTPCDGALAGRVTSPPPPARTSSATPPR